MIFRLKNAELVVNKPSIAAHTSCEDLRMLQDHVQKDSKAPIEQQQVEVGSDELAGHGEPILR